MSFKGKTVRLTVLFSTEKMETREQCNDIINANKYNSQCGILYPVKINFRKKDKIDFL